MIALTGSGKSLTFHITPFVLDFFKHGETDIVEAVCLVIFPLVSLIKDQVSSLCEKGVKVPIRKLKTLQRANTTLCLQVPRHCWAAIIPQFWHWRTKFKRFSLIKFTVWRNGYWYFVTLLTMLVNYDSSTTFRPLISLKFALVVTALCELCRFSEIFQLWKQLA